MPLTRRVWKLMVLLAKMAVNGNVFSVQQRYSARRAEAGSIWTAR